MSSQKEKGKTNPVKPIVFYKISYLGEQIWSAFDFGFRDMINFQRKNSFYLTHTQGDGQRTCKGM
jgi:hypothetical protein